MECCFFRSLEDRTFIGQEADENRTITSEIIKKNKVEDFQKLLHEANINCELSVEETIGGQELVIDFENRKLPFPKLMSTGTSALRLFFYWYMILEDQRVSFIFIDEFDAFYHRELSKLIIEKLKNSEIQFVLTTHNVSLMTNDLMRPDCIYLMGNNQIKSLSHCTNKQIREEHNIEKIYKSGGFNVN